MSNVYESALIDIFNQFDIDSFNVDLTEEFLFLCGGLIDAEATIPPSLRDRFLSYTATIEDSIHDTIVLAEKFKDYFKENLYSDLLVFEDEIANMSTLVIILLESPGSLVELGMFCTKPPLYKKLLIVAPQKEAKDEDSFIYLGPLEYIKKKSPTSVAIYPWADPKIAHYSKDNLDDLCDLIHNKLRSRNKTEKFNIKNSGHVAYLVCEIINLCYPILISDIELALAAMEIELSTSSISRHLYLLSTFNLIKQLHYSSYKYYYPTNEKNRKIKFGKTKDNKVLDVSRIKMNISASYVLSEDSLSRKRKNARKQIVEKNKRR